jgi:hypothetical protein
MSIRVMKAKQSGSSVTPPTVINRAYPPRDPFNRIPLVLGTILHELLNDEDVVALLHCTRSIHALFRNYRVKQTLRYGCLYRLPAYLIPTTVSFRLVECTSADPKRPLWNIPHGTKHVVIDRTSLSCSYGAHTTLLKYSRLPSSLFPTTLETVELDDQLSYFVVSGKIPLPTMSLHKVSVREMLYDIPETVRHLETCSGYMVKPDGQFTPLELSNRQLKWDNIEVLNIRAQSISCTGVFPPSLHTLTCRIYKSHHWIPVQSYPQLTSLNLTMPWTTPVTTEHLDLTGAVQLSVLRLYGLDTGGIMPLLPDTGALHTVCMFVHHNDVWMWHGFRLPCGVKHLNMRTESGWNIDWSTLITTNLTRLETLAIHEDWSVGCSSCQFLIIPDSVHTFQHTGHSVRPPTHIPHTVTHLIFGCSFQNGDPVLTSHSLESLTYLGFDAFKQNVSVERLSPDGLLTDRQLLIDISRDHMNSRGDGIRSLPNIQQCTSLKTVFLYGSMTCHTGSLPEGVEDVTVVANWTGGYPTHLPRSVKRVSLLGGDSELHTGMRTITISIPAGIENKDCVIEGDVVVRREQ